MRPCLLSMLAIAACFSPTTPSGAPCASDRDCPSPQTCQPNNTCGTSCVGCEDAASPPADTAVTGCWAAWLNGTVTFTDPQRVDALRVTGTSSTNASLGFDDLSIYLTRGDDIFAATRPSRDAPFAPATPMTALLSAAQDSRVTITADQKLAVFASSRIGTQGMLDLFQATRTSVDDEFGGISSAAFPMLNDPNQQFDPEMTPDGLHLYWSPSINGTQRIHHASRTSTSDPFGNEEVLQIPVGMLADLYDPSISPDRRVLLIGAQILDGDSDVFYVTRPSDDADFTSPRALPVNTDGHEGDPEVSADGCTVYFASNSGGQIDIHSITVRP